MSNRYRVEVDVLERKYGNITTRFMLLDYCVDVGKLPKVVEEFSNAIRAWLKANELNKQDGIAKAAWDAHNRPAPWKGVDMAAPGTEDATVAISARSGVFSLDIETQARRYFIGANGLAVYGTPGAIDMLRGKLNARSAKIQELSKANTQLRINLNDAQRAANDFKAERDKLAEAWQQCHNHNTEACAKALAAAQDDARLLRSELDAARAWWGADYTQVSNAATSRTLGVSMADHVAHLEMRSRQLDATQAEHWELKRKIHGLTGL